MSEHFEQKANKLMSKLSNLNPGSITNNYKKSQSSINPKLSANNSPLSQLHRFQQQVQTADDQNRKKIKILHDQINKLQCYLADENDARNKISQNFITTAAKVEKNMKSALQHIAKSFEDKQLKLQQKIEQILIHQKKQLDSQLTQNVLIAYNILKQDSLIFQIAQLSKQLTSLESQLEQMKRSRYVLEEKIYKQFIEQIKELKKIYERDVKERQQRENQLIECLKGVYTALMEQIKKEEMERQQNQKGFLTVVEQVISRIVEY